jgi:hypothetical protein
MSQADSRKVLSQILRCMQNTFQNSTRGARTRAWNRLTSPRGRAQIERLINNPSMGFNHFEEFLTFKEWLHKEMDNEE